MLVSSPLLDLGFWTGAGKVDTVIRVHADSSLMPVAWCCILAKSAHSKSESGLPGWKVLFSRLKRGEVVDES